jgi:DEAD/DEAH box helicase domain-containing protein
MIIYDVEIYRAIPQRGIVLESDVEYCDGWHDHKGMGIAVVGVFDYVRDCYHIFCQDNLQDFTELIARRDLAIGFNNLRFDNPILAAHGIPITSVSLYDLFIEVQRGLGLDFNDPGQRRSGYSLHGLAFANFRLGKSEAGENAPILWQRGNVGRVVDYCLQDIYLTKRLIDRVIRSGALVDPVNNGTIPIRRPGSF